MSFVQVGDGIEGLVHISEMAGHHVDLPEQVVTPGEELWVKIIDIDLQRRRISLSIKQAAEGGEVSEEYREAFGEHAYDEEGNYVGPVFAETEFTPETEAQAAWADYVAEHGSPPEGAVLPEGVDVLSLPLLLPRPRRRRFRWRRRHRPRQPAPAVRGPRGRRSGGRAGAGGRSSRRSHRGVALRGCRPPVVGGRHPTVAVGIGDRHAPG